MRTTTAAILSVTGVLVAGGVALAVNTSLLDTALADADAAAAMPMGLPAPIAAQETASSVVNDDGSIETFRTGVYSVPGFGLVTLIHGESTLTIGAVEPVTGITYVAEQESATRVEVEFISAAGIEIEFYAALIDGRVITSVISDDENEELVEESYDDSDDSSDEVDEVDEEDEIDEVDEPSDDGLPDDD